MKMEFAEQQENAALIQALQDAGCDKAAIEGLMKLKAIGHKKEMLCLLAVSLVSHPAKPLILRGYRQPPSLSQMKPCGTR